LNNSTTEIKNGLPMSIIKYRNKNINSKLKIHSNVLLSLIFALIPEISKEITIRKTKNQSNSV